MSALVPAPARRPNERSPGPTLVLHERLKEALDLNKEMRSALELALAILNPFSGFLKRGSAADQAYLEKVREVIRTAIAKAEGRRS
jgi:hypothetical protein